MIRAIRYVVSLLVFTGLNASRVLVAALFGVRRKPGGVYDRAGRDWGRQMLAAVGIRASVRGAERLPAGPAVFVANHVSFADIWVLLAILPGTVRFLAKRELLRWPLFGWAMKSAGHIPINRQNRGAAFGAYDEAAEMIHGGTSAIVFGEGTRSRDGQLKPLKKGPFVLAIKAGVPVVPVYLHGTFEAMPKGSISPRPLPVVVSIGEPIPTAGLDYEGRDQLAVQCHAALLALRDHVDAGVVAG